MHTALKSHYHELIKSDLKTDRVLRWLPFKLFKEVIEYGRLPLMKSVSEKTVTIISYTFQKLEKTDLNLLTRVKK